MSRLLSRLSTEQMSPRATAGRSTHTARRRLVRALMEAGVVLSLTFATVAVLCLFGLQRASALELVAGPASDGRMAVGAVLISAFVGLCGLTSFMLRNTLQPASRTEAPRRREG